MMRLEESDICPLIVTHYRANWPERIHEITAEPKALGRYLLRFTGGNLMSMLINILITFVVVILVLYLVNMLPIDGRAKQIVRVIVHHRYYLALAVSHRLLDFISA